MKAYEAQQIRNLSILGHAGSGKTTLTESLLFTTGTINRRGSVEDRNTVSDNTEIEHERGNSIYSTPTFVEFDGCKFNIIDTPGYDDYFGNTAAAIRVCDTGLIVVNAQNGIEVGTELAWQYSEKFSVPLMFLVNKLDLEQSDFDKTLDDLKTQFGSGVTVFQFPVKQGPGFNEVIDLLLMKSLKFTDDGKYVESDIPDSEKEKAESLRNEMVESIAESDEGLMNKYFDEGDLTYDDIKYGLKNAIVNRLIFPLFCASGRGNVGTTALLQFFRDVLPSPVDMPVAVDVNGKEVKCDSSLPASLLVYKFHSDPRLGDITYFRLYSGKMTSGKDMINVTRSSSERFGQMFAMNGKSRVEISEMNAGDIGAAVKLKNTHISDTLHEKGFDVQFNKIDYPNSKVRVAVVPKTKGEEEKVGLSLHNLTLEDPSLIIEHSQELRQMILYSQGEQHLSAAKWRLEKRYKVEAEFVEPRVPYRETIQKQVKGSYRHKKQSGGAGQFAEVHMMIDSWHENIPNPAGMSVRKKDLYDLDWGGKLEFIKCIVGGTIDDRFMPAILKGVMEKMQMGPLTGSYVRDIRVVIYDGKMHPVDSNEAAFKTAGAKVFQDNFHHASPKLLEPIYNIKIRVPEEFVGDVMSDLPSRRAVILGIDTDGRYQVVNARMPLAEMDKYATALRSMTQARATFNSEYAEYQTVPANIKQELIDAYKKSQEED